MLVLRVIATRAMVRHTSKTRKAQLVGDILEVVGLQRQGSDSYIVPSTGFGEGLTQML